MSDEIIGMHEWLNTAQGQHLLAWERIQMRAVLADIFGFHALQLGLSELDALALNRMPYRWLALSSMAEVSTCESFAGATRKVAFVSDFAALPFPANSLDLVVLPHTLEFAADAHAVLREVQRVLVPEGRAVICGLNSASLWGLRQRRAHCYRRLGFGSLYLPAAGRFIGYFRLRGWLRLLGLELELKRFGGFAPALTSALWFSRWRWFERLGERFWPVFGALYLLVVVKRVRGMTRLNPAWKPARWRPKVSVPVAPSVGATQANTERASQAEIR